MPLLGGLFGKKNKSSSGSNRGGVFAGSSAAAASDLESTLSSPTNSYVAADKSLPSSPNGKSYLHPDADRDASSSIYPSIASMSPAPSSSKLRMPFRRKKSAAPVSPPRPSFSASTDMNFMTPPRPSFTQHLSSSAASDTEAPDMRRLRPPPSKSAIFAAYADPNNALSTRSLPNDSTPSYSSMQIPPGPSLPVKEKRPSLFSWTKSTASSSKHTTTPDLNPTTPFDVPPPLAPDSPSSFNLRSFRHVRPPSPDTPNTSLVVPPARPRGASVNSDSSQRISVAAFREAQARRSTAGSPAPSFRSPSPSLPPPTFPQDGQRGRASPRPQHSAHSSPQISSRDQRRRSSSIAVGYSSESDDSSTSSSDESDDGVPGGSGTRGVRRNGTITQRTRPLIGKRQAKSEMGHGSSNDSSFRKDANFLTTRSQLGHGQVDTNVRQSSYVGNTNSSPVHVPPRSQSSLGVYGSRPRASASTSALSPTAAAKRASILVNANSGLNQDPLASLKQTTRHFRDSSTYSNPSQPTKKPADSDTSESESDDDNAPLASLVPPRRPGSAMSSASNASLRTNGTRGPVRAATKPLIDIAALTLKKPSVGPHRDDSDGFTKGGLLASQLTNQQSVVVESPTSISPPSPSIVTSKIPPGFTSFVPPTSPPKEVQAYLSLDSRLANTSAPTSPAVTGRKDASPESRRDVVAERLARLAKGKEKERENEGDEFKGRKSMSSPPTSPRSPPTLIQPTSPSKQSIKGGEVKPPAVVRPAVSGILKPSPPDKELIDVVDDSILRLISRTGESEPEVASDSESDSDDGYGASEGDKKVAEQEKPVEVAAPPHRPSQDKDRIAPIPIKQRAPPPAFSVMSRPPIQKQPEPSSGAKSVDRGTSLSPTISASPGSSARSPTVAESPSLPNLTRPRSSTLIPSPTSSSFGTSTSSFAKVNSRPASNNTLSTVNGSSTSVNTAGSRINSANMDRAIALKTVAGVNGRTTTPASSNSSSSIQQQSQPRQRSSTLLPTMSGQGQTKMLTTVAPAMPVKPFAVRRDSPASSTGDSSSGRAPLTPKDGSDIGVSSSKEEWSSGVSGLGTSSTKGIARHVKRRSVSFDDDVKEDASRKTRDVEASDPEARRRERRRGEAKAAIELGNVINGPGPIVSDDEDDDLPINQAMHSRMPAMNPMMGMGNPMQMQMPFGTPNGLNGWSGMPGWPQQGGAPQMLSPAQFLAPPPADPGFIAAHQQAMMFAKQAYQMAVAQQAMAAAADEWDRSSVMGGSVYGGGASNPSAMMGPPPLGMMGMGGMGMGNGWSTGSVVFPNSPRSMYGGGGMSSSRSEYGGGGGGGMGGGGNWSSARSSYGDSFGPSDRSRPGVGGRNRGSGMGRDSGYFPPVPPIPQSQSGGSSSAGAKGRGRTTSQPASPGRSAMRKAPPPSSWKAGV